MTAESKIAARNYLEVDLGQIQKNTHRVKQFVKGTQLMAVIKGNAYGLGIEPAAKAIEEYSDWFAVSTPEEAFQLREAGIKIPILVLGSVADKDIPRIIEEEITLTGLSLDYIEHLNRVAAGEKPLDIHIKIDTGLSRLGLYHADFDTEKYIQDIQKIMTLENLKVTGIYSHFAAADSKDKADQAFTEKQYAIFKAILDRAEDLDLDLGLKHICSSNALFDHQDKYLDMVRVGKYLFGYGQEEDKATLKVKTAFKLHAQIIRIVTLPEGQTAGYGRTYTADRTTTLATVTFGFADGFRRNMTGKAQAIVKGQKVEVVGRIAADYLQVDVTNIANIKVGDYVLLIGEEGDEAIYPSAIGKVIEGSTPEINTQLHSRVPRIYINNPVK